MGPGMGSPPVALLENVEKEYGVGPSRVRALKGINLRIDPGDFLAVIGPSGSGKSTLLHILGCMDVPTTGRVEIDGQPVPRESDTERTRLRGEKIGFVFQQFHLLYDISVRENIELPRLFLRQRDHAKLPEPEELVKLVNLPRAVLDRRPTQISGGEAQRVAIARALSNAPSLLLCDEPTGNLDSANSDSVLKIFDSLSKQGTTIAIVTHNPAVAHHADRVVTIKDGFLTEEPRAEAA